MVKVHYTNDILTQLHHTMVICLKTNSKYHYQSSIFPKASTIPQNSQVLGKCLRKTVTLQELLKQEGGKSTSILLKWKIQKTESPYFGEEDYSGNQELSLVVTKNHSHHERLLCDFTAQLSTGLPARSLGYVLYTNIDSPMKLLQTITWLNQQFLLLEQWRMVGVNLFKIRVSQLIQIGSKKSLHIQIISLNVTICTF